VDGKEIETWLCRSENFRAAGERKQAFDTYYSMHRLGNESPLEMLDRLGFGAEIRKMLLADFLTVNRDRHGANIELLISPDGSIRLSPLFDNGITFLAPYEGRPELYASFDAMQDVNTNNYIGTRSLFENLKFLQPKPQVDELQPSWHDELLQGLEDIIEPVLQEKIWEIVENRWKYYEAFCDKK